MFCAFSIHAAHCQFGGILILTFFPSILSICALFTSINELKNEWNCENTTGLSDGATITFLIGKTEGKNAKLPTTLIDHKQRKNNGQA